MTSRLEYIPLQTGYSSEELGGHIYIPLDGGPGRKRQDILLPSNIVTCQWLLNPVDYTRFMGFFTTTLRHARDNFLLDLITDIGEPTTHVCRLVGGLPRLTQQKYEGYWVTATLEVDNNPTFTGNIIYGIGEGASWIFDGVDDYITIGNVLDKEGLSDAFSVGYFAAVDGQDNHIVSKYSPALDRGWRFYIDLEDRLNFSIEHDGDGFPYNRIMVQSTATGFGDGVERHYFATYDGSGDAAGVTLYVNGEEIPSEIETNGNTLNASTLTSAPLNIGGANNIGGVGEGPTTIKHVSIWDRELTSGEVAQVRGTGLGYPDLSGLSFASDLEGWWKIDGSDSTGTDGVEDHSGNGFHGTAENGLGTGGVVQGQVVFSGIAKNFQEGDQIRIMNSAGVHPDGNIPLNLDGVYEVGPIIVGGAVNLLNPTLVSSDWTTLYEIDPSAEYGGPLTGNVNSTVTKVPT